MLEKKKVEMVYISGAQPSARGHFFARQGFLKCPSKVFFWGKKNQKRYVFSTKCPPVRFFLPAIVFLPKNFARQHYFHQKVARSKKRLGTTGLHGSID
jgi:hypothetical protein